jgi:putative membrane protein
MNNPQSLIIDILLSAVAIAITAYILPGVTVTLVGAIVATILLTFINIFIKPVLKILTLPITIITLGIFSLILNGFFIWLVAIIVPGLTVANFWWAIIFALVLSIINAGLFMLTNHGK